MKRLIKTAGNIEPMYVTSLAARCGDITGGISVQFGNEAGFVIDLHDLKQIIADAERYQATDEYRAYIGPCQHGVSPVHWCDEGCEERETP